MFPFVEITDYHDRYCSVNVFDFSVKWYSYQSDIKNAKDLRKHHNYKDCFSDLDSRMEGAKLLQTLHDDRKSRSAFWKMYYGSDLRLIRLHLIVEGKGESQSIGIIDSDGDYIIEPSPLSGLIYCNNRSERDDYYRYSGDRDSQYYYDNYFKTRKADKCIVAKKKEDDSFKIYNFCGAEMFAGKKIKTRFIEDKKTGKFIGYYDGEARVIENRYQNGHSLTDYFVIKQDEDKVKLNDFLTHFVAINMNEWLKKNEFESAQEYAARQTDYAYNCVMKYLTSKAVILYQSLYPGGIFDIGDYDAENQTFLLKSDIGDVVTIVPKDKAISFKQDYSRGQIGARNFSFSVSGEKINLDNIVLSYKDDNLVARTDYPYTARDNDYIAKRSFSVNLDARSLNQRKSAIMKHPDLDIHIPETGRKRDKTFAVIISNENYEYADPVMFANNDGKIFKSYCTKTLGIPEDNIHFKNDATLNNIRSEITWIKRVASAYGDEAKFLIYYAGHGIADDKTQTQYLLPADGYASDVATAYKLEDLYASLAETNAPVTVLLDACFSGEKRGGGMLVSGRMAAIKSTQAKPQGKLVVLSASKDDEPSYPLEAMAHGTFTYYLLDKLKATKGDCTLGELFDYVSKKVQQAVITNPKPQTPTAAVSPEIQDSWRTQKL
ncbi:MAG: caspase family protein [Bacteroidales bacterium]|nr:caspase family protein [Bacteroidales bacterium]